MTTVHEYPRVCALCGRESLQRQLASCSTFDGPDLDGRPAPMLRNTMQCWIERCPHCGYAAETIGRRPHISQQVLDGMIQAVGCMDGGSMLARDFMRIAMRYDKRRNLKSAVRWSLYAAWVCDDDGNDSGAVCAREWCLKRLSPLLAKGRKAARRRYAVLYADLLRRTGSSEMLTFTPGESLLDDQTAQFLNCERELFLLGKYGVHRAEEYEFVYDDFACERPTLLAAEDICERLLGNTNYLELPRLLCEDATERQRTLAAYPARMTIWARPLVEYQYGLSGGELYEGRLPPVDTLAASADIALFSLLEKQVLSKDAAQACPPYPNALAMALLHLLYTSERIPNHLKAYARFQKPRLYVINRFCNMEELFFSEREDIAEEIVTSLLIEPKQA